MKNVKSRRYLVLLRGINVGGSNIIRMAALKACFEGLGCADVATYIQSGNVVFSAAIGDQAMLGRTIEDALSEQFKYKAKIVVVPVGVLRRVVAEAPKGFGARPNRYRYDVIFLKEPLTPQKAMGAVEVKAGVDDASAGKHALYFSRLISKAAQSRLSRVIQKPEYQYMTIRNWNTTTRLLVLTERSHVTASRPRGAAR
ncbi:MAG TPA: DUF1697 domain-containing protein [bacterium]